MEQALRQFIEGNLFSASDKLLDKLNIKHTQEEPTPMRFQDYYESDVPQYIDKALQLAKEYYYLGEVCDDAIKGTANPNTKLNEDIEKLRANAHYKSMMLFAVDLESSAHITRSDFAVLTRAFNRLVYNFPVTVIFRQGHFLSIATCERTEFKQEWRQGQGEKLGKVSLLRNIDCSKPHRGHLDILDSINSKDFTTFDELYKHWQDVFSSELLTKKFYSELADWYAWAIKVVRFPNDLKTEDDNEKYNAEAMIRLITRLIFVWFIKQRHLVPEEFFDEKYISDNLLKSFTPNAIVTLFGKADNSYYYKGILQNLFFAMLNSPITPEGKDTITERRFRTDRGDYDNNKLMRHKELFKNPDLFVELANKYVPYLNGGLFDCLDDKDNGIYIDAFTDRESISRQLIVPDYLFFGEDVGRNIDLSEWYGDDNKKKVSARGIIDILKRYNFTIEENTPLEQEVSLDPELLGKVFENLLASYNPETQTTARKQTGSFYTPREIVQHMVNESLIAHLKKTVGDEMEPIFRQLIQYNDDEPSLNIDQKKSIMQSLYNCKILDPACGSGAFPMGMLQQMVHILNRIDPDNIQWKEMMLNNAINETSEAYRSATDEERKEMVTDIERSFNESINRPDYARKLYLIENCIYGVDIQPIAIQISKLRFFISLVVDQKTNTNPADNFGIRPLPNLESKFVAADTLLGLEKKEANLFDSDTIRAKEKALKEAKHRIFGAKTIKTKRKYKEAVASLRIEIADMLKESGCIGNEVAQKLSRWDMFEQNTHADFFDAEWMFGVSGGFDIVIANPPYVVVPKNNKYSSYFQTKDCLEMYAYFFEKAIQLLAPGGVLSFITASLYIKGIKFDSLRSYLEKNTKLINLNVVGDNVFENVQMPTAILIITKEKGNWSFAEMIPGGQILTHMEKSGSILDSISNIQRGFEIGRDQVFSHGDYPFITGSNVSRYIHTSLSYIYKETYLAFAKDDYYYTGERLLLRETGSSLTVLYENEKLYCNRSLYSIKIKNEKFPVKYVLACLNSKACQYYYSSKFKSETDLFPKIRIKQARLLPIPSATNEQKLSLISLVDQILKNKNENNNADTTSIEKQIDFIVFHLYNLSFDEVKVIDPQTSITKEEYESI